MGGGSDARQKKTLLSFPVPLPISFLTSSALSLSPLRAPSLPSLGSHVADERAPPARLSGPPRDEAPAKRRRVDEGDERASLIGIWGPPSLSEAEHESVNEPSRGEVAWRPDLSPPSTAITRLQRKIGVGDINVSSENGEPSLIPAQRQEVSPLQRQQQALNSPEQQLPQGTRGKRQFAVAAELLQSIPIWRRHPESIPALLKAAAEVLALRQRRQAAGEPLKADSMLDGGPFSSATIHWETRRQALCVKAHTPAGRCACRYFPVNRLSPSRGDASRRTSGGPSTACQKRGPSVAGEKQLIVCPKRLLFAAYVFFLQLPLLRPGSSQRVSRELYPGPPLTLPAGALTADSCREMKAETQGGPRGLPRGLYCGTTTETANRQSSAAATRRDRAHAECERGAFRIAAEALAAAAVAVGCLSASAPLAEQHQHHQPLQDNGQQQAARQATTVALLRWSFQPVDADASERCDSAGIGRLEQLRLFLTQQQDQQQRQQPQHHEGQSFVGPQPQLRLSPEGGSEAEGEARVASTSGNSCSSSVCREAALTCKLCGHRTGTSAAEAMSAFEGHCLHLLQSHAFLAPLVSLILSVCPSKGQAAAVATPCPAAAAACGRGKSNRGEIARALRRLSSDKGSPCRCLQCHQQQQEQEYQMAPFGGRSPYAYLSRAAFTAAATVATEGMLQELEAVVPVNAEWAAAERRRLLLSISSEAASVKCPSSSAEGRPPEPGSPTPPLTQEYQGQELSPPATAARGETTLPRLLQEQETMLQRLLELQLLRPASGACGAQLLRLALQGPMRGPLAVCTAAAPTQQAAAFLTQHLRAAVGSLMFLPSVRKTIAAATLPGNPGALAAASAAVDIPHGCSGSVRAALRQRQRLRATPLRRILSEERVECNDSSNTSKSRCMQHGSLSVTASVACSKRRLNASRLFRRTSWYEALALTPQCSSTLPVESCAAASVAATGFKTAASRRAVGTAAETLHLLALLVPPVGGPSLQQDRLEILTLEREASSSHPYVSFLLQGDFHAVPQSIGSLYLALPQPSRAVASQLRKYLAACVRPLTLELLFSRSAADTAAPTSDAETATTVPTHFARAAASAANSFRRQLQTAEAVAEALCCSDDNVSSGSEVVPLRPLLQYVSARTHCLRCGKSGSQVHLCSTCAAALEAAAAAANTKEAGTLSASSDLDNRVLRFLSEVLLSFLEIWEREDDEALSSATDAQVDLFPLDTCQTPATAAEADEDCVGSLADVLTTHASVQRECLSFGGLPRGCDDSQTGKAVLLHAVAGSMHFLFSGLWIQATPFVAHVVRGVPLMARHQLHRLAAPGDTANVSGDSKGAGVAPAAAAAFGTTSSRRCASNGACIIPSADSNSSVLSQQACVNCPSAALEASPGFAFVLAGAIEGTRGTSPVASSFSSLSRAVEPVTTRRPRIHFASPEEDDPVPWKSIDLFAWSLLDENGASPELSLHLRRSKAFSRKRTSIRPSFGESPASRTSETTGACTDEAPSPAAATIAATAAAAGSTGKARSACQPCDFAGPPTHGDSSNRVLAAVWQAATCRTLDFAVAEAQCRRISPFSGVLIEECGCIPEAADLQLRRNELLSVCEAMERLKTAQVYETTCKAAQLAARQKHLRVAKSAVHGWGVFAAEPIRRGEFIVEYAGNAVAEAKANFLEEQYVQSMGGSTYFFKLRDGSIVDATSCGAATRFINHSCVPNCCTVDILDEDDEAGGSHVGLLALRDIDAGEELSYNYR
ncbi:hypothetical protein Esti_006524 [Eimeria stiedai]